MILSQTGYESIGNERRTNALSLILGGALIELSERDYAIPLMTGSVCRRETKFPRVGHSDQKAVPAAIHIHLELARNGQKEPFLTKKEPRLRKKEQ